MKKPFFSIVIATYNYARFLEEAISSVLSQSCQDFELIIVDGGSSDNSVEIIKKYAGRIPWWCSERDSGQAQAFNKGFSHANGRVLTWLNADDLLLPGALEMAKAKFQRDPGCKWVTANFLRFLDGGEIYDPKWGPHYLPGPLQRPDAPLAIYGPTAFYTKELYSSVGGMDEVLCAHHSMDTDLWLRFMALGVRNHRLNHYCWAFRMHEASKTAEYQSHRVPADRRKYYDELALKVRAKNGYRLSPLLRFLQLFWRVLDGSLLAAAFIRVFLKGKNIYQRYPGLPQPQKDLA